MVPGDEKYHIWHHQRQICLNLQYQGPNSRLQQLLPLVSALTTITRFHEAEDKELIQGKRKEQAAHLIEKLEVNSCKQSRSNTQALGRTLKGKAPTHQALCIEYVSQLRWRKWL